MLGKVWDAFVVISMCLSITQTNSKPPNIVFMVADDFGWNDIGFRNPDMKTPTLDKLATEGVILDQAYVQYVCSPSRSAFMSGRYPYTLGLQHIVIFIGQAVGLPLNVTTLPQELKRAGYATHIVGKWHLGMCKWEYTPIYRGFDSFFGYYSSREDYYDHTNTYNHWTGLDLRENKDLVRTDNGTFFSYLVTKHVEKVIEEHDSSKPLFLYLPWHLAHEPLQVPARFEQIYSHIKDDKRRIYSGMISALDEGVRNVTDALIKKGIFDDTILIFTTDNGGPVTEGANNYPLRGSKWTFWEGGTRATAFVHSKLLKRSGYMNTGMMHAVDWFPTVLDMAGLKPSDPTIDGVSVWPMINENLPSPRTEFIYNIDDMLPTEAIRYGDYKLIRGSPGSLNGWYPPPQYHDTTYLKQPKENNLTPEVRLYNLREDPTEHVNLASAMPAMVEQLTTKLNEYRKKMVPANFPPADPKSNPALWNGAWSPGWC